MQYSNSKLALTMFAQDQDGPPISAILRSKLYVNDSNPNKISIHDTSRLKVGRNSFHNRLKCLRNINFNWKGINPDALWINLKKTFFNITNKVNHSMFKFLPPFLFIFVLLSVLFYFNASNVFVSLILYLVKLSSLLKRF